MNIRTQHGFTHELNRQLRLAATPPQPDGSTSEATDSAAGEAAADARHVPLGLSEAVMQQWCAQVASRRMLGRCINGEHGDGNDGNQTGSHAEDDLVWAEPFDVNAPARPAALQLPERRTAMLERYAGAVYGNHPAQAEAPVSGGAVVVDLDEAVHGSYAAVKDMQHVGKEGWGAIGNEYQAMSDAWTQTPLTALQSCAAPASALELGINLGVGAPLGALAWKAAREGHQAIGAARANGALLLLREKQVAGSRDELQLAVGKIRDKPGSQALTPLLHAMQRRLLAQSHAAQELRTARQHNRMAGRIGWGALVSGASIVGKVGVTAPVSAGLGIASAAAGHGIAGSSALVASSSAAGIIATAGGIAATALSFPAAAGAVGIGALFVKKSKAQYREFVTRALPTQIHLRRTRHPLTAYDVAGKPGDISRSADGCTRRYCDFVLAKSQMRGRFYRSFARMNMGFLGGSALYGAGAVGTGAAIGVAAIAGLSNPIGWGVLTALGTLGGLVMAANSLQFLRGHHRQQRYDAYLERDDPELDRDFLASLEIMLPPDRDGTADRRAIDLRARFYDMIGQRDGHRQAFLRSVAGDVGRYYAGQVHSSDDAATRDNKLAMAPTLMQRLKALLVGRGNALPLSRRNGFDLRTSLADLRTQGQRTYRALSTGQLQQWLNDPRHYHEQLDFMARAMGEQRAYLRQKLALRQEILDSTAPQSRQALAWLEEQETQAARARPINTPGVHELEAARATGRFLAGQDEGIERDSLMLSEVMLLENELGRLGRQDGTQPLAPPNRMRLALLKERFMRLSAGNPYNPRTGLACKQDEVDAQLARWLHDSGGAEQRMRHLRGVLVDVEMQATELRNLSHSLSREAEILTQESRHRHPAARDEDAITAAPASPSIASPSTASPASPHIQPQEA